MWCVGACIVFVWYVNVSVVFCMVCGVRVGVCVVRGIRVDVCVVFVWVFVSEDRSYQASGQDKGIYHHRGRTDD